MKPPTACYWLMNKAFAFPPPPEGYSLPPDPLTTTCWCLQSMEAFGSDGGEASLEACNRTRDCYKPEVDL